MAKQITTTITRFDGGIIDDIREKSDNGFQISTHFDNTTNPLRLTPYRNSEANETKAQNILRFAFANGQLYGLGVATGNERPAIYYKASNNIEDDWTAPTDNEAASGDNRDTRAFWHYKDYLYGFSGTTVLWNWGDLTATPTFDETHNTTFAAFSNVANGITHPADDICYFATDNLIHRINGKDATVDKSQLTLPDNMIVTDLEPVGNFLAIACRPKNNGEKSRVYLWDRDSSLATLSQVVDWGEGDLLYIAYLDGRLIGITDYFLNDSAIGLDRGKLIIKLAVGDKARTVKEIQQTADDTTRFFPNSGVAGQEAVKIVKDNRMYFPVASQDQSDIWRGFAVVDSQGRITMDYVEEEAAATSIQGGFLLGQNWFIAHSGDGSINRTDDGANYTYTSVYQSQKFTAGDASKTKKLLGVTVMTAPQPTAGVTVLRYRKDEETTWTLIFSNSTDNSISHSAINIESSGATLPEYKEIQFRIESTGGTEITGLKFKSEILEKDIY